MTSCESRKKRREASYQSAGGRCCEGGGRYCHRKKKAVCRPNPSSSRSYCLLIPLSCFQALCSASGSSPTDLSPTGVPGLPLCHYLSSLPLAFPPPHAHEQHNHCSGLVTLWLWQALIHGPLPPLVTVMVLAFYLPSPPSSVSSLASSSLLLLLLLPSPYQQVRGWV